MGAWLKRIGLGVLVIAILGTVAERLGLDAYGVSAGLRPYAGQEARELREVFLSIMKFHEWHREVSARAL